MIAMKVNPKNDNAAAILRNNLDQFGVKFVMRGTAFVFDTMGYLYDVVFTGLSHSGVGATVEDQSNSITNDDLEELRNAG